MLRIIKSEIEYNWYHYIIITLLFLLYTIFSLTNFRLLDSPELEIDYWGGIYSLVLYTFLIFVWVNRIKENRIRIHSLLPITQSQNSLSRFWTASLPFIILFLYLIIIHLVVIDNWHSETGTLIGQVGVTLILYAGYIRGRDDWFSYWEFGKRSQVAFVTVLIMQILVVAVFFIMKDLNKSLIGIFGPDAFHYAKLIFPLLGFTIMITSIYSFRKRKSFLQ